MDQKKKASSAQSRGLARIRYTRRLLLAIIFAFLPVTAVTMAYIRRSGQWVVLAIPLALVGVGMVVQYILQQQRCPRCGEFFFHQKMTGETYQPGSAWSFPPQKKCQHCGLVLYR